MNVYRPRLDINIVSPDSIQQLLPGKHAARMHHQVSQEAEFSRAEMNWVARTRHPMRRGIELNIGVLQYVLAGMGLRASHDGTQPSHQFAGAERLDDIVVRATIEAAHPVGFFAARC